MFLFRELSVDGWALLRNLPDELQLNDAVSGMMIGIERVVVDVTRLVKLLSGQPARTQNHRQA